MRILLFSILWMVPLFCSGPSVPYSVSFEGIEERALIDTLHSVCQLTTLQKRPPASLIALRHRADGDIPEILKVLHALGYFEAVASVRLENGEEKPDVVIAIQKGPLYKIHDIELHLVENQTPQTEDSLSLLEESDLQRGSPAKAEAILKAQDRFIELLMQKGYPLATVIDRKIIADGDTKNVQLVLTINRGPLCSFGPTVVHGLRQVLPKFLEAQKQWTPGQQYDSRKIDALHRSLVHTGLFQSVVITPQTPSIDQTILPMQIDVVEAKHRTVHIGASYQTFFGPGITFGWEHRNLMGLGRKFRLQADLTQKTHSGKATFTALDAWEKGQDLTLQAQALHEAVRAFSKRSYSVEGQIERKLGIQTSVSVKARTEKMYVTSSSDNGIFLLFSLPVSVYWTSNPSQDTLNPTKGISLEYLCSPTYALEQGKRRASPFLMQKIAQNSYYPLLDTKLILAQKITIGSISSDGIRTVPVPYRFFGGSEEDLRGYNYWTVSPMKGDKPMGGRSAIFYTLETRLRLSKNVGLVPFFDLGNVYANPLPTLRNKWLKSTGIGVRYFSYLGPLRLDIGFPLNERKQFDRHYRVLVSLGQMF